jgi:hypothetical protein
MSATMQIKLSGSSLGRITLHLATLNQDWKFRWHLKGVWREIVRARA